MQHVTDKHTKHVTKHVSSEQEAHFDLELNRKAKEIYRAYAEKIMDANANKHAAVQYPIHWQFSTMKSEKKLHAAESSSHNS